MDAVDIVILIVLVLAVIVGFSKGFIKRIGTIAGFILGILVCRFFGDTVAGFFVVDTPHATLFRIIIYVILFVAVFVCVRLVAKVLCKTLSMLRVRALDRICGAIFSFAAWVLIISVLFNAYFAVFPAKDDGFYSQSKPWRAAIVKVAPKVFGYIVNEVK